MIGVQRKKGVGARAMVAPTKSDTVDDPAGVSRGFYCDVAGTLKFNDAKGNTLSITTFVAGQEYDIGISRVWSTTTTATIYLLY